MIELLKDLGLWYMDGVRELAHADPHIGPLLAAFMLAAPFCAIGWLCREYFRKRTNRKLLLKYKRESEEFFRRAKAGQDPGKVPLFEKITETGFRSMKLNGNAALVQDAYEWKGPEAARKLAEKLS